MVFSGIARADDPLAKPKDPVAQDHLTQGNKLYRLREFEKAIDEYKAGVLREDAPVFLYNLGQCYRQLGKYEDAIAQNLAHAALAAGFTVRFSISTLAAALADLLSHELMPPSSAASVATPNPTS